LCAHQALASVDKLRFVHSRSTFIHEWIKALHVPGAAMPFAARFRQASKPPFIGNGVTKISSPGLSTVYYAIAFRITGVLCIIKFEDKRNG